MHAMYSQTQNNTYTKMNLSTVKWAQWDKTQSREPSVLFICVCRSLCTTVAHNIAQNRPDNFPCYPPDNHHCSGDVYLREGALSVCLSICHIRSSEMSPAKTAEPIEMPFKLRTRVGPRNHVLDGGPDHPWEEVILKGKGRHIVKYRDTLRPFPAPLSCTARCPL